MEISGSKSPRGLIESPIGWKKRIFKPKTVFCHVSSHKNKFLRASPRRFGVPKIGSIPTPRAEDGSVQVETGPNKRFHVVPTLKRPIKQKNLETSEILKADFPGRLFGNLGR